MRMAVVIVVVVVGLLGRPERQTRVSVGSVVMMLMRPQAMSVFERSAHRARLPDAALAVEHSGSADMRASTPQTTSRAEPHDWLRCSPVATTLSRRDRLLRRGLRLEYATLAWNAAEVIFVFYAAAVARSVALAGFALDSCIEIFASVIVVERLKNATDEAKERRAERRIGYAFFALAVYLTVQAIVTVVAQIHPKSSPFGIAWLAATVIVMFTLAVAKLRTGRALQHAVLETEAMVTMVDGALATAILVGLALNAAFGWWWADVAGGIVVIIYGIREGVHAIREAES